MKVLMCSSLVLIVLVVALTDAHDNEPQFTNVDGCRATKIHMPVCASDGNSYVNSDVFKCANDKAGGTLTVTHDGACTDHDHTHDDHQDKMSASGSSYSSYLAFSAIALTLLCLK